MMHTSFRITGFLLLAWILLFSCKKEEPLPPFNPTPYVLVRPEGFPAPMEPADNPTTVEGVALGRKLFYETLLSANNTQSCGSCHNQSLAFSDNGNRYSTGIDGIQGNRNAQALFNLALNAISKEADALTALLK